MEWIEKLINDLTPTTSIFIKQLGTHLAKEMKMTDKHGGKVEEFPEHLRLRNFPLINSSKYSIGFKRCFVAALFVQTNGCYYLKGVDAWDINRDARLYNGNLPVVAHPPCQLWGNMAFVNYARWGGEHNKPFNDGGCFKSALESVNRCFGVLEHPAKTRAWDFYGIEKPNKKGWSKSGDGWVCEVWQSAYGHRAQKATWLYYRGNKPPFELRWDKNKGSHQIGFQDQRGKSKNKPTLSKKEANATPIDFRDELIGLAVYAAT